MLDDAANSGSLAASLEPWQRAWLLSRNSPYNFFVGVLGALPVGAPNPHKLDQLEQWQEDVLKTLGRGLDAFDRFAEEKACDTGAAEDREAKRDRRLTIKSGHGTGKSYLFSGLALWAVSTRLDCKVPIIAGGENQLRDTLSPEIRKLHAKLPEALRNRIHCDIERMHLRAAPESSFVTLRTASSANTQALAGIHAGFVLILVDEATAVHESLYEPLQGSLSTPGAVAVLAGQPTKTDGYFYRTHTDLFDDWRCFTVNSEDVPRARGHIEDIIREYGKDSDQYRVRVLGQFPLNSSYSVIPMGWIQSAVGRVVSPHNVKPVWGLDPGIKSDPCGFAKRRGNVLLEPPKEWRNLDEMQIADAVFTEWQSTQVSDRPHAIAVDAIGIGSGVYSRLKQMGLPARQIVVSERARQPERFLNLRSDMWWSGRLWFEPGNAASIPEGCDGFMAELSAPNYDERAGKIEVEGKRSMEKRKVRSPNLADAFLHTLLVRDVPASEPVQDYAIRTRAAKPRRRAGFIS